MERPKDTTESGSLLVSSNGLRSQAAGHDICCAALGSHTKGTMRIGKSSQERQLPEVADFELEHE
jgi:hypothetical protein